jgi:O-antigen ligase
LLIGLFAYSLVRGLLTFPTGSVASEARAWIYLAAAFLWTVVGLRQGRLDKPDVVKSIMAIAGVLSGAALLHLYLHGIGRPDDLLVLGSETRTSRVLVSGQAIFLGGAAVLGFSEGQRSGRASFTYASLIFLTVVAIAQHRSVWVAVVAGLLVYALFSSPRSRRRIVATLATVSGLALLVAMLMGFDLIAYVSAQLSNRNTYNDRTRGWSSLIEASLDHGWWSVLMGQPTGTGWVRVEKDGSLASYQPHNWYVTVYLRVGLLGLAVLLVGLAILLAQLARHRQSVALSAVVMVGVYCWAYGLTWYLGPLLALCVADLENVLNRASGPNVREDSSNEAVS